MKRSVNKHGAPTGKRRKINVGEINSDESITKICQQLYGKQKQRIPRWDCLFGKYKSLSCETVLSLNSTTDWVSESTENSLKERKYDLQRSTIKVQNWLQECESALNSSKDVCDVRTEVDEDAGANEDARAVENITISVSSENPLPKSRLVLGEPPKKGKMVKKKNVKKNIYKKKEHQLRSMNKRGENLEKEREEDSIENCISDEVDVSKECEESDCEATKPIQNTILPEQSPQNTNLRVNDIFSEGNEGSSDTEEYPKKQVHNKKGSKNQNIPSHLEEMQKDKMENKRIIKKNIYKKGYQLRSMKKREENLEKEREEDDMDNCISDEVDVSKECLENNCEETVHDTCSEKSKGSSDTEENPEKQVPIKKDSKSQNIPSHLEEIKEGKTVNNRIVEKNIYKKEHQLQSVIKEEENLEKEREDDDIDNCISDEADVSKECLENNCEGTVHDTFSKRSKGSSDTEENSKKLVPFKKGSKNQNIPSHHEEIKKENKRIIKKNIYKKGYQLRSMKKREENLEKEREEDDIDNCISDEAGVSKECLKNNCEGTVNGTFSERSKGSSDTEQNPEKQVPIKKDLKNQNIPSHLEEIKEGKMANNRVVKKNIYKKEHQLQSMIKREENLEKEREEDDIDNCISDEADVSEECLGNNCEGTVNYTFSERSKGSSDPEENPVPIKEGLESQNVLSSHIEIKKEDSDRDLEDHLVKDHGNCYQNSPHRKLDGSLKGNKQMRGVKNEFLPNSANLSQYSNVNLSIESYNLSTEKIKSEYDLPTQMTSGTEKQKKEQNRNFTYFPKETNRSDWNTEFTNFMRYRWNDFRKNPGSVWFPLPKLKPSGNDETLSWENIMNSN